MRRLKKSLKPQNYRKFITYLTWIILRSYVDKLKWLISSDWAALGHVLLNVLLASHVNIHRLHSCWRITFWAHAVIMWHISLSVTRVCRYSVNHFWADACALQYEFVVANSQTTKYWISQDSVATVLRRDGLNYSHLCSVSSWCSVPKIKINQCFTKLFKK